MISVKGFWWVFQLDLSSLTKEVFWDQNLTLLENLTKNIEDKIKMLMLFCVFINFWLLSEAILEDKC